MDDYNQNVKASSRKRSRWCSRNLIEFLDSLGRDITSKISENDVATIITNYIRENHSTAEKKRKIKTVVGCDERLRLLFERQEINLVKLPDLVAKHYVENQEESDEMAKQVDMEEKVPSLYGDVTKHSRLLHEVVGEELDPECVNDDAKLESGFIEPNSEASSEAHQSDKEQQPSDSPVSTIQEDGENQPTLTGSAGDRDLYGEAFESSANGITHNKDSISEEVEMIVLDNKPQAQPNPIEIIHLIDDDDDDGDDDANEDKKNNRDDQHCDPTKVLWFYELPKGQTHGPFSITDLKRWNDNEYFAEIPDFKVWMRGESAESAVSLTKLLSYANEDKNNNQDDQHFNPTKVLWFYELSKGQTHGPFSITDLKRWSDDEYFAEIPDFKVWMRGESSESAVSLTKLLSYISKLN